uniref:Variant surface glycoprotein 1125.368 n=1 Tax=Trypanosoma brucei TaxID=5691 RepID=A0A1J0R5T0_9TRYP|nr:variant surface glycoprotein 1125.368 [Trypanosoma brucei]
MNGTIWNTWALLTIIALASPAAGATTKPIKGSVWTGACSIAGDMRKIQAKAAHNIEQASLIADLYMQRLLRTAVYIEAERDGVYTKQDIALLTLYADKASQALKTTTGATFRKLTTAIADAARLDGRIGEFIQIMAGFGDKGTHSCLATKTGTNDYRVYSKPLNTDAPGCVDPEEDIKPTATIDTKFTANGHSSAEFQSAAGATGTGGSVECALTTGLNSNKVLNSGAGVTLTKSPEFAGGLFKYAASDLNTVDLRNLKTGATVSKALQRAHAAYLQAKQAPPAFTEPTPTSLSIDEGMSKYYRIHVLGPTPDKLTEAHNLAQTIASAYKRSEELKPEYGKKFSQTDIYNPTSSTPPTIKLDRVSPLPDLISILLHYRQKNQEKLKDTIAQLEKQINKESSKTPDKICNDVGDKNETGCKNTSGCHFVSTNPEGTKCTLNPEAAKKVAEETETGKDGKATNTTGSNSFVINKAPLLLAFLIL